MWKISKINGDKYRYNWNVQGRDYNFVLRKIDRMLENNYLDTGTKKELEEDKEKILRSIDNKDSDLSFLMKAKYR